ncbi:hypothetical protein BDC45DRAFT_530929 [Circinella umbellata]|nr:hypothetical protein BDC45DRAFT_530929 [Circinella umbellata]
MTVQNLEIVLIKQLDKFKEIFISDKKNSESVCITIGRVQQLSMDEPTIQMSLKKLLKGRGKNDIYTHVTLRSCHSVAVREMKDKNNKIQILRKNKSTYAFFEVSNEEVNHHVLLTIPFFFIKIDRQAIIALNMLPFLKQLNYKMFVTKTQQMD